MASTALKFVLFGLIVIVGKYATVFATVYSIKCPVQLVPDKAPLQFCQNGTGIFAINSNPCKHGSYGDIVRGVLSPGIPASPEIDENGLTEVYLVPRIDVCMGTEVDIPQNIVAVAKYMSMLGLSNSEGLETKTVWDSMADHIRRACDKHNANIANQETDFDSFEIISGRVIVAALDYGLGYISILFKVVQNEDFDEGPQFAMVMSDRNVFPKPFEKLPFDSCAKYGYTEYEVLVRCCEVGEFIYMLQAAPGFLG